MAIATIAFPLVSDTCDTLYNSKRFMLQIASFPGHMLGMRLWGGGGGGFSKRRGQGWVQELLTSKLLSPRWTSDTQNSEGRREHVYHVDTRIAWKEREGGGGGPAQS